MNDDLMRPFPFSVNLSSLKRGRLVKTAKPYLWESMTFGFFTGILLIEKKVIPSQNTEAYDGHCGTEDSHDPNQYHRCDHSNRNVCVLAPPVRNHCGVTRGNTAFVQTD